MRSLTLQDFDYKLPQTLIAQAPSEHRGQSRLLLVPKHGAFEDREFRELPNLLRPGDLLVFNDSKVIPARLYARKETGGQIEILVERLLRHNQALVMLRSSKKPAEGSSLLIQGRSGNCPSTVRVIGRDKTHGDRFLVDFGEPALPLLDRLGELPLPPYIAHCPTQEDIDRYQTVYATRPGSVAAPTAGLHFDAQILQSLNSNGIQTAKVTLHVGSGTFSPVRSENLDDHKMHEEWCEIGPNTAEQIVKAKQQGRRVIAVGTTSLRTLETAASQQFPNTSSIGWKDLPTSSLSGHWETDLFIKPGYSFRVVDGLITNFHLPKSTLLMLVSALAGHEKTMEAYRHAIQQEYRFFSYGDACLFV